MAAASDRGVGVLISRRMFSGVPVTWGEVVGVPEPGVKEIVGVKVPMGRIFPSAWLGIGLEDRCEKKKPAKANRANRPRPAE